MIPISTRATCSPPGSSRGTEPQDEYVVEELMQQSLPTGAS